MAAAVILVSASGVQGGAERALAGLAGALPEHGVEALVVLLQEGPFEEWLREAGQTTLVVPAGRLRQPHRYASAVRRLAAIVRDARNPVVLSNMTKAHLYAGVAAMLCRAPSVLWQHMVPERSAMELAAAAIPCRTGVCSTEAAAQAQRSLTPRRPVHAIPPGTDVERVRSFAGSGRDIRRRCGWGAEPLVGIVGRLQPWKGQELFLEAAAAIVERIPSVRIVVVGGAILGWEGSYADDLRRLAARLGIADHVSFVGHQDPVYPWFDALDVVVNASRGEPYGLVLVEAMALGTPVVAPSDPGPRSIIENGRSGLLVPPRSAPAIADAVCRLLGEDALRKTISSGAASRASELSLDRTAARFATLFHDLRGR
ncbi:MAG: glycosyltransferase family 4 protein [Acidimicrobiia bacterium]|nr:glycosyltransferase family 4 protein [Acidimicrobiia bacterium]